MTRFRQETGQSAVISVLFLTVLLGMAAIAIDVGSWYQAHRAAQATADAAALAAAQALPEEPTTAAALAATYATSNGGGLATTTVSDGVLEDDTVTVTVEREAPGFFARLFDIDSVEVDAKAAARSANPSAAQYVAPVVVNHLHPDLLNFKHPTQIDLDFLHKPGSSDGAGSFGLINLRGSGDSGSVGSAELAKWMAEGFDGVMEPGIYRAAPSTMFNSSHFRDAMQVRTGDDVLFPVYRSLLKGGSTAEYDIIGWVGFHITEWSGTGSSGTVKGWFTRFIAKGISSTSAGTPNFGVRTISLVE
jgi:Flp pilus assembly protein TadG